MIRCYQKALIIHFYFNSERETEYVINNIELSDNELQIGAPNTNHPEQRTPSSRSEHNDTNYESPIDTPNNDSEDLMLIKNVEEVCVHRMRRKRRNVMKENWV